MTARCTAAFASAAALLAFASSANATLTLEPVFNFVPGTGGSGTTIPIFGFLPFLTADEPGEIITYPAGFPADPVLVDVVRIWNNTDYDITGFMLSLIGTAVEPVPFDFTIDRGPVDAVFGDVDGDGQVGVSDIFATITVSADGKTISFSDGLIPRGSRFTDFNLAMTSDDQPFLAAIDASFSGTGPIPEPATWAMMIIGFGLVGAGIRARRRKLVAV